MKNEKDTKKTEKNLQKTMWNYNPISSPHSIWTLVPTAPSPAFTRISATPELLSEPLNLFQL